MLKRVAVTFSIPKKVVPYLDAMRAVGTEPVAVCPQDAPAGLEGFAGLLISGGIDINPARYGQARHETVTEVDDARDDLESRMLAAALEAQLPVLAICRGMQLLNVHQGGTLVQHFDGHRVVSDDPSLPVHGVDVQAGSHLAEIYGGPVQVNSRHHQCVERLGEGLVVTSRSLDDGVIEGVEMPGEGFVVGVQWHPEDQFAAQRCLFEAFAARL